MFYPIFTVAMLAYSAYYQMFCLRERFSRSSSQIGLLRFNMGSEMVQRGLDTVEKAQIFYHGKEAPQLVQMVFNSLMHFDDLPENYVHPLKPVLPVVKILHLGTTVLVDTLISNAQNIHKLVNLYTSTQVNDPALDFKFRDAIRNYSMQEVKEMLSSGYDMERSSVSPYILLREAVMNSGEEMVKLLIDKGVDINARNGDGDSALHHTASKSEIRGMKLLINAGADVNARNNYGVTPLMYAARQITSEAAIILMEHGADVNAVNNEGDTALHLLLRNNLRTNMLKALCAHGADSRIENNEGETALDIAKSRGRQDVAEILMEHMKGVNKKTYAERIINEKKYHTLRQPTEIYRKL